MKVIFFLFVSCIVISCNRSTTPESKPLAPSPLELEVSASTSAGQKLWKELDTLCSSYIGSSVDVVMEFNRVTDEEASFFTTNRDRAVKPYVKSRFERGSWSSGKHWIGEDLHRELIKYQSGQITFTTWSAVNTSKGCKLVLTQTRKATEDEVALDHKRGEELNDSAN